MNNTCNNYPHLLNMKIILVPSYLSLIVLLHVFTFRITVVQPLPYPVEENITIDCGSEGKTTSHAMRSWDGDGQGSKFLHLSEGHENASISVRAVERPDDPVPYETARLSRSEIRYTIPLIPGPKFIRLYFFASTYDKNYDRSKALLSVKAGR